MAERPYSFFSNPFLVVTTENYNKMNRLSRFTDEALAADPARAAQLAIVHAKRVIYAAAYEAWLGSGGERNASTKSMKILMEDLPHQANDWDFEIQHFAKKGTPDYDIYFPHGHAPFNSGKYDDRISAVSALVVELGKRSPMPPIKDTINDYLTDLNAASGTQTGKISNVEALSNAVEAARLEMGVAMYKAMAQLMDIFAETPTNAAVYFDMELLRRRPQDDFNGHTAPQTYETIVKRSMDEDDQLFIKNTGLVPLTYFWANVKNGPIPDGVTGLTLQPSEQTHVPASALGHPATDKYLSVYNASEIAEGEWEVEL